MYRYYDQVVRLPCIYTRRSRTPRRIRWDITSSLHMRCRGVYSIHYHNMTQLCTLSKLIHGYRVVSNQLRPPRSSDREIHPDAKPNTTLSSADILGLEGEARADLFWVSIVIQGFRRPRVDLTLWVAWSSFWVSKEAPTPRVTPSRRRTL